MSRFLVTAGAVPAFPLGGRSPRPRTGFFAAAAALATTAFLRHTFDTKEMNMTRIFLIVATALLGCAGMAAAAPVLKIEDSVWTAGIIVSGKTYEKRLVIENAGDKPLVIEKVEECCGFFATLPEKKQLLPGEKAELLLRLAPFKMVGDLRAEMFIVSNDPAMPRFSIFAIAEVVPSLHALADLAAREVDLGQFGLRDRVPFKVRLRNLGNTPLEILQVEKPENVIEVGSRPKIGPGEEKEIAFEYSSKGSGQIDERLTIVTNDALERSLEVQLKGQVLREYVTERAISIYPPGGNASYDVVAKAYRFDFTVSNNGPHVIELPMIECSIQGTKRSMPHFVQPGESVKASVIFPNGPAAAPNNGYIFLQLAIPVELR